MMHEAERRLRAAMAKPRRKNQSAVSGNIAALTREAKAGTGPHFGAHGPLVPKGRRDILAAIAYSKARRGEALR